MAFGQFGIMTHVKQSLTPEKVEEIRQTFQYCPPGTVEAILRFRAEGDPSDVPTIVLGIIGREASSKSADALQNATEDSRFLEDLGIDSLTMLEIVMGIEEALNVKVEDSELRGIQTIGDVNRFLAAKLMTCAAPTALDDAPGTPTVFSYQQILETLPQQPPFLFMDHARREGDVLISEYRVRGDEDCLKGHFKNNPIFPASLVFEALGQAGCLWILMSPEITKTRRGDGEILFASLDGANFHSKVRAGDHLEMHVALTRLRAPVAIFKGEVTCQGRLVARVERLMLAFGELPEDPETEDPPPPL
jgi:3-hydroxyacyl-[acyl-carrier-protein] dehydratase